MILTCELVNREAGIGDDGVETYTYQYLITTNDLNESEIVILNCIDLPIQWSPHPFNPNARCKNRRAAQDRSNPMFWNVTITYDTKPWEVGSSSETPGETTQQTPPDDRAPTINYDKQEIMEPREEDVSEPPKPFVMPNGIPFDPLPEFPVSIGVIKIKFWSTTYTPGVKWLYENRVNSLSMTIDGEDYPAGSLWCKNVAGNRRYENYLTRVYEVDLELWYHPEGDWALLKYLASGTMARLEVDGEAIQIIDDSGNSITSPKLLDADGLVLAEGDDPVVLEYLKFREADFTALVPAALQV